MCKTTIVSREGDVCVTHCLNCKIVNIWNKGVLVAFSFEQFDAFLKATKDLVFDNYIEYNPDGIGVVILATPFSEVSLVFTRVEWDEFFAALKQAAYMKQIYQMVHD